MAFTDIPPEPRMVSYLDVYIWAGVNGHLKKSTMQKITGYTKDVMFGFPQLEMKIVQKCLRDMGVDIEKEVEERVCFHRPKCMSVDSRKEDKPIAFGLAFFGLERTDPEWKKQIREGKVA